MTSIVAESSLAAFVNSILLSVVSVHRQSSIGPTRYDEYSWILKAYTEMPQTAVVVATMMRR